MPNRLANAVSPYLRSHAENPVDWWEWGDEPFAEARRRGLPLLVSIGYSTCHWCHVMARESFSDPALAEYLNAHFVAIKVDREEHHAVDSTYMAAAGAFTEQLGWPLNVFVTPDGGAFYAGTYWPPTPVGQHPAFRQVLEAVVDAWEHRRDEVDANATAIAEALRAHGARAASPLPDKAALARVVEELAAFEDRQFGGFGGAPKFPVSPALAFLLDRGRGGDEGAFELALRTLDRMAASPLRDSVDGGFFRYATKRDWSEPHYERMLSDNAQLLAIAARAGRADIARGVAGFLLGTLRLESGAFAAAQDSESTVDGRRQEGVYYERDAAGRRELAPPPLDDKVLAGWNGLAIDALATAGDVLGEPEWIEAATRAAEVIIDRHIDRSTGALRLVRATLGDRASAAAPALEDFGMLANGMLSLALVSGRVAFASLARELVDATLDGDAFALPGGGDPVLVAHGLARETDASDGAAPSGLSALARAALRLHALTDDARYRAAAEATIAGIGPIAVQRGLSFGAALSVAAELDAPLRQLVVVVPAVRSSDDEALIGLAREWKPVGGVVTIMTEADAASFAAAGFELYAGRSALGGRATAYLCEHFTCRLPVTSEPELRSLLAGE